MIVSKNKMKIFQEDWKKVKKNLSMRESRINKK